VIASPSGTHIFKITQYRIDSGCNDVAHWVINVPGTEDVNITGSPFPIVTGGLVYNFFGSGRYDSAVAAINIQQNHLLWRTSRRKHLGTKQLFSSNRCQKFVFATKPLQRDSFEAKLLLERPSA
jgi:hypothetical protein